MSEVERIATRIELSACDLKIGRYVDIEMIRHDLDALIAAVRAENEDRVQTAVSRAEHAERRADDLQTQLFAQNERHKRQLSAVRAEALEEAAVVCEDSAEGYMTKGASAIVGVERRARAEHLAYRIRALKGTSPPKLKLDELPGKWPGDETDEEIAETLAEVNGTAPQSPWRPIETAPKDGTWIYVIGPEYETPMPAQWGLLNINPNKYDGAHGWSGNGYIFNDAVYWRPITKDWPEIPVVCENCDGTGRITTDSIGGKQCPECATFAPAPPTEEAG